MNLEDHLPPEEKEPEFHETLHMLIEQGEYTEASSLLTSSLLDFFYDFVNEPVLFGLLTQANHVEILDTEDETVLFNTTRKCMYIPHRVAHAIHSPQDMAFLLLVERARLIVNRTAHIYLPSDMDLSQASHKAIFEMALSCWSIALSRCYCASILPERLYAPYSDMWHSLMHGLIPEPTAKFLARAQFPNIANIYEKLYMQEGQEQYHFMLNRMAPNSSGTLTFSTVLPFFWEDLKKNAPTNEQIEEMLEAVLVSNNDGEDDKPADAQAAMKDAAKNDNQASPVPTSNLAIENDIDEYLSKFVSVSLDNRFSHVVETNSMYVPDLGKIRAGFSGMHHTVMLEAQDDVGQHIFGSIMPPEHVSTQDLAAYMQGHPPMLWETRMSPQNQQQGDSRYDIYFDISGSMTQWFPVVRAMIAQLGPYVNPDHIYGFSTVVKPIDMSGSFLLTNGSTYIGCAIKHLQARKGTRAILITDMQDYVQINTDNVEHIIIVGTDYVATDKFDVSKTVFNKANSSTKIDYVGLKFSELITKQTDIGVSFNDILQRVNSKNK